MNTGRIDEYNLPFRFRDYALNLEACGLGFIRDSGDLLTDEAVKQGRLAGIWTTDKGDISGVIGSIGQDASLSHGSEHCSPRRPLVATVFSRRALLGPQASSPASVTLKVTWWQR